VTTTAGVGRAPYDWVRLTYPRGQTGGIRVDTHGWFVPAPWYDADRLNDFATLDQVRDEPVVLLVSASGIGKSTTLTQEHSALTRSFSCLVDLKSLTGRPAAVARLSEATQMPSPSPASPWHVLLDGFDEALKRDPDLVELLDQWLQTWTETQRSQLRLRIATRPGVRENAALEEMLGNHWRPDEVILRDMAPLTRDDVLGAARARGVPDPDGLAAGLQQRGLVPVTSIPIPLTTLLDRAADGHPLPATAEEVYRLACEQLCAEANLAREGPEGLGLQEVMGAAARLAAVLEFCGNGTLTDSLLTSPGGPVRLVDVAAAVETVTGGQAEKALRWLTTTPLLRSLSDGQWQFAHQRIQAFLAAEYLKVRQLAPVNVQSLLFAGPGTARYVHDKHLDLAGWLAWQRPEVRDELLAHDPAALLSLDLPAQPQAVRARVVDALFSAAERGSSMPRLLYGQLYRADHPGLAGQLRRRLTPAVARLPADRRYPVALAVALARACPDQAPADALLDLAEDDQIEAGIRTAAVDAVPPTAVAGAASRLQALTAAPAAQVAQAALLSLWPGHMSTADLLSRAPITAPEVFWQRIELNLTAADLGTVTAWIPQHFGEAPGELPAGVRRLLTWTGTTLSPSDGQQPRQQAATQLAELLIPLLRTTALAYDPMLADVRDTWAGNPEWRRMIAGQVLARLTPTDDDALAAMTHETLALIPAGDSIYWAKKAAADTTGSLAILGSPLKLRSPSSTPDLTELHEELKDNLRLAELTSRWFEPAPDWYLEKEEQTAERRTAISSNLERLVAERPDPDQVRSWWLGIIRWLNRDPRLEAQSVLGIHLDLSVTPSCPAPGSPLRETLQTAALHAVGQAPVVTAGQFPSILHIADASEVTALTLLSEPPSLEPERWAGLALVLAFTEIDYADQGPRQELLARAAGHAGISFTQVLPAALSALPTLRAANVVSVLVGGAGLGDQVDQAVLTWAASPDLPAAAWRSAMQAIAPHDRLSLPVLTQLAALADQGFPVGGDSDAQQGWAQAIDLLLQHGRDSTLPSRWAQILASPQATAAWAQAAEDAGIGFSLYAHSPVAYWPPAYLALTPHQARQFYDRLTELGMIDITHPGAVRDISGPGRRGMHNRLPELIAHYLTETAAGELRALIKDHPEQPHLPALAAEHARQLSENLPPLTLTEFTTLTTDLNSRIVRDITELTQVVLDALGTLQNQALQSHGWSTLMWNRWDEEATDGWWPVWEDHLSNLICAFLREHLTTQKPVINREVEIQPPRRDGGRTDIHIQAPDPGDAALQPLTAIIEVKGCWNAQIKTGIPEQLIPYLQPRPGWAGIFLVGHFHQPDHEHENYTGWPATSERKKNAGRHRTSKVHTPEQILRDLQEQIGSAPADIIVHARVVQFPLIPPPAPSPAEAP